jgi:hypothetical protein
MGLLTSRRIFNKVRLKDFDEYNVCVCVKFCFILSKTFTETLKIINEIEKNTTRQLRAILKNTLHEIFQKWNEHRERCIASRGDYFERDK